MADAKLARYRQMRDFAQTAEPTGDQARTAPSARLRFVIQKHAATRLHFDLRLEWEGTFKSWAVTRGPSLNPHDRRLAVEVEDHPLDYGDFEGVIPKGQYGGGTVQLWDRGFWAPEPGFEDVDKALAAGELKFVMEGERLHGGWVLVRLRDDKAKRSQWLLIKHRDPAAIDGDGAALMPKLRALKTDASPFTGAGAPRKAAGVHWVKPELVAEIQYAGFTGDGAIRQASFKGLSQDKPAAEVEAEAPAPAKEAELKSPTPGRVRAASPKSAAVVLGVTVSHPDKALWPDDGAGATVTKLDLARYFGAVGAWMLPHLRGRPCSMVRLPDGLGRERFFQRHASRGASSLFTEAEVAGEKKPYLQIDRVEALVAAAQVAAVELHPWNCAPFAPEQPGRLVFDLDPAPDVPFERVIEAAKEVKDRLEAIGLEAFCKTTGGKGLHVVTPIAAEGIDWPAAKAFARALCQAMAADAPTRFLITMAKKDRGGRIFLDYLRNDRTATAVAPLSPRERAGATVSMPLTWAQVRKGLDPKAYTLRTVPALLPKLKAWADYDRAERPLKPAMDRLGRG